MSRYAVDKVMRQVMQEETAFRAFQEDAKAFLESRDLTNEERAALIQVDYPTLYRLGAHPFVLGGFTRRVWRGDRRALEAEYRQKIAPYGYPDFAT